MEHLIKETGGLLKEGRSAGWWGLGVGCEGSEKVNLAQALDTGHLA